MSHPIKLPIVNERGERLVAVRDGSDSQAFNTEPAQVSLVLAHHQRGVVLVRNIRHGSWELPGGFINPHEIAIDCAVRELEEESGLVANQIALLSLLDIECPGGDWLRCALYQCRAEGIPRACGTEISEIAFWNAESTLKPISAIDAALLCQFVKV